MTSTSAIWPRCGAAIALGLLSLSRAVPAHARQITSEIVEAMIVHLDQRDAEGRAKADSLWEIHDPERPLQPHDTVFVLKREHLQQIAGMSLKDVEDLMLALHRRGVPARWCQVKCPLHGVDQTLTIKWAMPVGPNRLVVEGEIYGLHAQEEFDPSALYAWMHRKSFHLVKQGNRWRVTHSSTGYFADYSRGP